MILLLVLLLAPKAIEVFGADEQKQRCANYTNVMIVVNYILWMKLVLEYVEAYNARMQSEKGCILYRIAMVFTFDIIQVLLMQTVTANVVLEMFIIDPLKQCLVSDETNRNALYGLEFMEIIGSTNPIVKIVQLYIFLTTIPSVLYSWLTQLFSRGMQLYNQAVQFYSWTTDWYNWATSPFGGFYSDNKTKTESWYKHGLSYISFDEYRRKYALFSVLCDVIKAVCDVIKAVYYFVKSSTFIISCICYVISNVKLITCIVVFFFELRNSISILHLLFDTQSWHIMQQTCDHLQSAPMKCFCLLSGSKKVITEICSESPTKPTTRSDTNDAKTKANDAKAETNNVKAETSRQYTFSQANERRKANARRSQNNKDESKDNMFLQMIVLAVVMIACVYILYLVCYAWQTNPEATKQSSSTSPPLRNATSPPLRNATVFNERDKWELDCVAGYHSCD